MADRRLKLRSFAGGLSDDDATGPKDSASVADCIDARRGQNMLTLKPRLQKESGSVVTTEICDAARVVGGVVYAAGGTEIYKRVPGAGGPGTWSNDSSVGNLQGVRDLDYRPDLDSLFLYDEELIHELTNVSGTPTYSYDKYTAYVVLNQNDATTVGSYTLPTSITESAANLIGFTCTKEPLHSVTFKVSAKGASGNWTVTIHDAANRVVATKTISFASVPAANNDITFTFDDPVRLKIGAAYHIHLTCSAGTHSVYSATASDLSAADCSTKAYRLVNTGEIGHRTLQDGPKTLFCNERYVGEWDILETGDNATGGYDPHKLILPSEVASIGMAFYSEYRAIAAQIDDSVDTTTDQISKGVIFFWDGVSPNYNFVVDVPQGVPHSLFSYNNVLYFEAGGRWCRWAGGEVEVVFEFPTNELSETDVLPALQVSFPAARQAMAVRDSQLIMGWPESITELNSEPYQGLFSYGQTKQAMPKSFGFDSFLSTEAPSPTIIGSQSSGITLVKNFGNHLLVAWRDEVSTGVMGYGVDYINEHSPAAGLGLWLSLWFDNRDPDKEKSAKAIKITCDELPAGCSILPVFQNGRDGSLTYGDPIIEGAKEVIMPLHERFYEGRFGLAMYSVSGNYPRARTISFKFDDNRQETNDTEVARGA